jgi:hypothetical protein
MVRASTISTVLAPKTARRKTTVDEVLTADARFRSR